MPLQYSVALRNAQLDQIEQVIGASARLEIRTGAPPANAAAADTGTLLATITLPADWLAAAASGSVSRAGTWSAAATAAGVAGHFRLKNNAGTVTHAQGNITGTGGGGDMTLDNTNIANNQTVTVDTFTVSAGNA